ncbi:MAG: hypothetical protein J7J86_04530 [Bacteroidales bacterium]|nr:hypothetical protein [Bacteroidales bacterium]
MTHAEIIGYIAGLIISISLTPQVIKAWKTKSTKDISISWSILYVTGLILWIIYGSMINSLPLIITISFELSMAITLLFLKIRYK